MAFRILVDSCTDLPLSYIMEHDLETIPLTFTFDNGEEFQDDWGRQITGADFYKRLREGATAQTSQITSEAFVAKFRQILDKSGEDLFYPAFSSALSGTYQSAVLAIEQIKSEYPDRNIIAVDTRCASLGEGLLVDCIVQLRDQGKSLDETVQWTEDHKFFVHHWVAVDDLTSLKRGGRISSAAAIMGTMLSIKPLINVDNAGHLIPVGKIRTRKRSLQKLAELTRRYIDTSFGAPFGNHIFIVHADCLEEAQQVASMIKEGTGLETTLTHLMGSTIAAHIGPGTIAVFFLGRDREDFKVDA